MDRFKKAVLGAFTVVYFNVNKHYKLYRKALNAVNPFFRPLYHLLDFKMIVNGREIPLRVFSPKKNGIPKILLFFHGGAWVAGNIDSYTKICANMAEQTKHTVISVNYRLAPEHPFPAGLEDCYFVAREIFKNSALLRCHSKDITLIGDSAGGNLAAAVSLMARDNGEFLPCRQILLYPSTYYDHSENSPYPSVREYGTGYLLTSEEVQRYMEMYVPNAKDKCSPYAAPILAGDLSNQPKTLIITAEFDLLRDEGEAYGTRLKDFMNDVRIYRMEDSLHGFLSFPRKSKAINKCYEIINDFLRDESHSDKGLI